LSGPEADQQVAAEADQFPAAEGHEQVVAEHDAEHREQEQAELPRETRGARVVVHVPGVEHQHRGTEAAHDHRHDRAGRVGADADTERERTEVEPGRMRAGRRAASGHDRDRLPQRECGVEQHRAGRQRVREAGAAPRQRCGDQRGQQRHAQYHHRQPRRRHERSSRVRSRSTSLLVR
jgi:hypothetical protein